MYQQSRRKLIIPFIAPQLILYVTFVFLPLAATIFYGFTNWQGHGNAWETAVGVESVASGRRRVGPR